PQAQHRGHLAADADAHAARPRTRRDRDPDDLPDQPAAGRIQVDPAGPLDVGTGAGVWRARLESKNPVEFAHGSTSSMTDRNARAKRWVRQHTIILFSKLGAAFAGSPGTTRASPASSCREKAPKGHNECCSAG